MDMKRLWFAISAFLPFAIFIAAIWYFASPLFHDNTLVEPAPHGLAALAKHAQPAPLPVVEQASLFMSPVAPRVAANVMGAATSPRSVSSTESPTPMPTAKPTATATAIPTEEIAGTFTSVRQGSFEDGDVYHQSTGVATLYLSPDSNHLLRFEDFVTTGGPDLHVLLSPNAHPMDHVTLGKALDIGALQSTIGDQTYLLPVGLDAKPYKSVVIYSLSFHIVFAVATLE
jgi:hypothetical protein